MMKWKNYNYKKAVGIILIIAVSIASTLLWFTGFEGTGIQCLNPKTLRKKSALPTPSEVPVTKPSIKPPPTTVKYAVVHVGPHKTGTTTIQALSEKFMKSLAMDNYHMPWVNIANGKRIGNTKKTGQNQVNLATCFYSDALAEGCPDAAPEKTQEQFPCNDKFLKNGLKIAAHDKNVFITSEEFDRGFVDIQALRDYLEHWDRVRIVVYYRRFYDWTFSIYDERMKKYPIGTLIPAFHDMNEFFDSTGEIKYSMQVFQRYKNFFDDVIIVNMHDPSKDLTEAFYCDAMPHAEHTCNKVKKMIETREKSNQSKGNTYIGYRRLALAAAAKYKEHINIQSEDELNILIEQIQNHQENTLARSFDDFKKICPLQEQYDLLLQKSLEFEKELLPDFYASPLGEAELRSDFEQSKSKMCSIDYEEVLEIEEWANYFSSMKYI